MGAYLSPGYELTYTVLYGIIFQNMALPLFIAVTTYNPVYFLFLFIPFISAVEDGIDTRTF
jgi:hypothetical protein